MSTTMYDPLDDMMAWEDSTLDDEGIVRLFRHLVSTGAAWTLQGAYGREAQRLLEAGVLEGPKLA